MAVTTSSDPVRPTDSAVTKQDERRALGVAAGAHVMHDGYTDLIWVALPICVGDGGQFPAPLKYV